MTTDHEAAGVRSSDGTGWHLPARFRLQRGGMKLVAVVGVSAVAMVVTSLVTSNPHWAVGAIFPFFVTIAIWWCQPRAWGGELTDTGLRIDGRRAEIPYSEMIHAEIVGKGRGSGGEGAILVEYGGGIEWIPLPLDTDAGAVVEFLRSRMEPSEQAVIVPESVRPFYDDQCQRFGADRVQVFSPRRDTPPRPERYYALPVSIALTLTAIAWIIIGISSIRLEGWAGAGGILLFSALFGFLIALVGRGAVDRRLRKCANAALVVAPSGMALVLGDLRGTISWEEIREIKCRPETRLGVASGRGMRLQVVVPGTTIEVADVFDAPVTEIATLMRRHLAPPM